MRGQPDEACIPSTNVTLGLYDTAHLLRSKGLKARRLEDGLPEWRIAGMPTVTD